MLKLDGNKIYLSVLEKEHGRTLWADGEYDFENRTELLQIGYSIEKADDWFAEVQSLQGKKNVRLGIFLQGDTVIGDVALQDIDWHNRSCSLGMGVSKLCYRNVCSSGRRI